MGENMKKKKRHIGLKILLTFLLLLLAGAAGLGVYFYPTYRAAEYMSENLRFSQMEYTIRMTLDRDELNKGQKLLIDTLAEMTGITREAMGHLTIQGNVDGDIIYAAVYPEGQSRPLTELYLSDGSDVVNGAMLYSAMRDNFCGRNEDLNYLFPVWEDHRYMSLEQAEDMLGVDLGSVRNFKLSFRDRKLSVLQCFCILAFMDRKEADGGECFSFRADGMDVTMWLQKQMAGDITVTDPADVLEELNGKLSVARVRLNGEKLRVLDSISVTAAMKQDISLQVPEDLISRKTVDIVKGIRLVIKGLSEN